MLFNSYIFILLFLPLALIGYFQLNRLHLYKQSNAYMVVMSLWFYGFYNFSYLYVICGSIVVNYAISKLISSNNKTDCLRKVLLAIGIIVNSLSIFIFKYYDFFISNINRAFDSSFHFLHIALPLGISFFTFQQISYLVDSYRDETKDYGFVEYALFVSFFPQLIAGPIVLHREIIPQFRSNIKREWNSDNFSKGIYIFAIGLFKKVLIADTFGRLVSAGYGTIVDLSSLEAILVSLAYTFQLYFDFSGYCDMAIGVGCMFNIEITQNFNSPYKATSVIDFWARWHMSLTRFLREYVYFPLGGGKRGTSRKHVNIMIVFLISGIWHGANWTFIFWGVIHGIANCLTRLFHSSWKKMNIIFQWFLTFSFVNVMWIFFRANSINDAIIFLKKIFTMKSFSIRSDFLEYFHLVEFRFVEQKISLLNYLPSRISGFYMWLFFILAFLIVLNFKNSKEICFKPTLPRAIFTTILLTWSILSFSGISTFLYFDF